MTLFSRITILVLASCASACATDPGDVGSDSDTLSTSAEGNGSSDDADSQSSSLSGDDDGGSTTQGESTVSTSLTGDDDDDGSTSASESNGSEDGTQTSDDGSSSGSATESGDTGTMVADCSECGPDEGCVAEVAFATEYFCVPIPDDCGVEFNCECASEYCVDPFTVCQDFPDPPQRAIACECPNC